MDGFPAVCVSVVVPTLNREESLRHFLEGALCQTCAGYEIVIVDQSDERPVLQEF
jgi:glycosyltransferase involved in cell wall biosynthesis